MLLGSNSAYLVGSQGGEYTHTLIEEELPGHTHTVSFNGSHDHDRGTMNITGSVGQGYTSNGTINGGWHNHNNKGYGTGALYLSGTSNGSSCTWSQYSDAGSITLDASKGWTGRTSSEGNHSHTVNGGGSGVAHNNMMPYYVVNIWKRIS